EQRMVASFRDVVAMAERHGAYTRTAAYMYAIHRIAESLRMRGLLRAPARQALRAAAGYSAGTCAYAGAGPPGLCRRGGLLRGRRDSAAQRRINACGSLKEPNEQKRRDPGCSRVSRSPW